MKDNHLFGITVSAAAILGLAIFAWPGETTMPEQSAVDLREFGIDVTFSYPTEYSPSYGFIDQTHRTHFLYMLTEDPIPRDGEGPTAITIDIYQNNLDGNTARGFITGHSDSNYKLGDGKIATTTYGSLEGLEYTWSGLYEGRSFVVARPDWIYMFTVTRIEPTDRILGNFEGLLETVRIQ